MAEIASTVTLRVSSRSVGLDLVEVERSRFEGLLAAVREELACQPRGLLGRLADLGDLLAPFRLAPQAAKQDFGVAAVVARPSHRLSRKSRKIALGTYADTDQP